MIPISTPRGALSQGEMVSMAPPMGLHVRPRDMSVGVKDRLREQTRRNCHKPRLLEAPVRLAGERILGSMITRHQRTEPPGWVPKRLLGGAAAISLKLKA